MITCVLRVARPYGKSHSRTRVAFSRCDNVRLSQAEYTQKEQTVASLLLRKGRGGGDSELASAGEGAP